MYELYDGMLFPGRIEGTVRAPKLFKPLAHDVNHVAFFQQPIIRGLSVHAEHGTGES